MKQQPKRRGPKPRKKNEGFRYPFGLFNVLELFARPRKPRYLK